MNKSTFGILFKKTLRDLKKGWLQFLAIIFISTLAITLFVGLSANAQSLENRVNDFYKGGNMADIWTYVSYIESSDDEAITNAVGDKGQYERRLSMSTKLNGADATALISKEMPTINKPYRTDNTKDNHFFIVDENFKSSTVSTETIKAGDEATVTIDLTNFINNLEIGEDELELLDDLAKGDTESERKANNIFRQGKMEFNFVVTGTMLHPENVQNSSFSDAVYLLDYDYFIDSFGEMVRNSFRVDIADLFEEIFGELDFDSYIMYNQFVIKLDKQKDVGPVKKEIEEYFSTKGEDTNLLYITTKDTLPSNAVIQNDITQARQLTYIFPMIFFVVAILVTLTTLSQIIIKERTQIGTLKAIGLSRLTIFMHYLILAFLIAGVGILLGSIIGPLLLPNIMGIKYGILYTLPPMQYTFPVFEFLLVSGALLLATFLVTLYVTHKELKLNPVESMRPASLSNLKAKKQTKINNKMFATKMAFRNIRMDIFKSIMVIIGVLGCTALLVCGFGIDNTLDNGVSKDVAAYYCGDLSMGYQAGSKSQIDDIKNTPYDGSTLGDHIESIEEFTKMPATISFNEKMADYSVIGVKYNSDFFGFPVSENNLSISSKVARELGLKVNDEVSFTVFGAAYKGKIEYIFDTFTVHSIIFNNELSEYQSIVKTRTNAWINLKNKSEVNLIKAALESKSGISSVATKKESNDKINSIMSSISYMTMAVKIFAVLLAIVVLYNLVLLNYRERTRDIATLKVLGFTKFEIAKSLIFEVMFLTTIGIIFGLLLGKPMQVLVLMVNETPLVDFLYTTYPSTYIIGFLLTFGTAMVTNLLLSNLTGKIKMVESLKSVE